MFSKYNFADKNQAEIEKILNYNTSILKNLTPENISKIMDELIVSNILHSIQNTNPKIPNKLYFDAANNIGIARIEKKELFAYQNYLHKIYSFLKSNDFSRSHEIKSELKKIILRKIDDFMQQTSSKLTNKQRQDILKIKQNISNVQLTLGSMRQDSNPLYVKIANYIYMKKPSFRANNVTILKEDLHEIILELSDADQKKYTIYLKLAAGTRPGEELKIYPGDNNTEKILEI